jgi:hypothetical protein
MLKASASFRNPKEKLIAINISLRAIEEVNMGNMDSFNVEAGIGGLNYEI